MRVYADTSAFFSMLDSDDPNNAAATRVWFQLLDDKDTLISSNYVVVETVSLLHRRFGVPSVNRFRANILPVVQVEWVDTEAHVAGLSAVAVSARRGPSIVDCVSFELMRRLSIRKAFAYDQHFATAGFETV